MLAWGVGLVAVGLTGLALVFQLLERRRFSVANRSQMSWRSPRRVPFAWFGPLIVTRRPCNRIGALVLAAAVSLAAAGFAQAYARYGVRDDQPLPAFELVNWLGNWTTPTQTTALVLLLLLFPDGQAASRRWQRWVVWPVVAWSVVAIVLAAVAPELDLEGATELRNPFGLRFLGSLGQLWWMWFVVAPACLLAAAASLVVRYRRGGPIERHQLKWLALAAVLPVASWVLYLLNWLGEWGNTVGALGSWGVPMWRRNKKVARSTRRPPRMAARSLWANAAGPCASDKLDTTWQASPDRSVYLVSRLIYACHSSVRAGWGAQAATMTF
jgi:hypothetical protein